MKAHFLKWRSQKHSNRKHSSQGFTLLELLVVLIIIGVLAAIAGTGWNAIMNRERVNSVREQVTQVIRQAQADARRSKIPRVVVFDASTGVLRMAVVPQTLDSRGEEVTSTFVTAINNWQTVGNGNVAANALAYTFAPANARPNANQGQLVFDSNGAVATVSASRAAAASVNGKPYIFAVSVQQPNTSAATKRCVIVSTLLGGLRQADGSNNECP